MPPFVRYGAIPNDARGLFLVQRLENTPCNSQGTIHGARDQTKFDQLQDKRLNSAPSSSTNISRWI